jgi:NTP pyrophosphatase (non-canonical NTP hydrolase)
MKNIKQKKVNKREYVDSPFGQYFNLLSDYDKSFRNTQEFGSILILSLVEEVGEMSRAYLAKHGRKKTNLSAEKDETYEQELGDILVAIIRFAHVKNINLHERILYTIHKIQKRQKTPKK